MNNAQRDIRRKKRILEHAARIGNVRKTCHSCNTTRVTAKQGFRVRRQTNPDHCGCVARETSCRCAAWCGVL